MPDTQPALTTAAPAQTAPRTASLARLQQFTTLGGLALAALWALGFWLAGRPVWAFAGAAFLVAMYALVLGIEFIMLALVRGDDPSPRATPGQLLRAWCGEVGAGLNIFCWQQPFRSARWPDRLPTSAQGRRGVLLVHGLVCNRGVWNSWLQRLTRADVPFVAVNLAPVFGTIDGYAAGIDAAVQQLEQHTGLPPVVVAHSMGGLALRAWWSLDGNAARVHHAITIGTPHQGTWLARFAMGHNGRQMRRASPWMQDLCAREPSTHPQRFTCFYSHCDNIVFPASTATLAGADNRHLPGVAHVRMVEADAPWCELQQRLRAGE